MMKSLAQLIRKREKLLKALAYVETEIQNVKSITAPDKKSEKWERCRSVYDLVAKDGMTVIDIAKLQRRSIGSVRRDFREAEDRYAPLCLVRLRRRVDGREWTRINRCFSFESAQEAWERETEVVSFEQYATLIWNSTMHGGNSYTEDGAYQIIRKGIPGYHSSYLALHVPSGWESPLFYGEYHGANADAAWINDIEVCLMGNGAQAAKEAAEAHFIALQSNSICRFGKRQKTAW